MEIRKSPLESVGIKGMINRGFWTNKKVFITGHTGFKGSWLCLWLRMLGADVTGYALEPPTQPNLFGLNGLEREIRNIIADVRDGERLRTAVLKSQPDIIFHMAAQPLVRESYLNPVETYQINVMGTVNLLEAARSCVGIKAIVNITTDKCYENKEWVWGYRENEALGGYDPYSNSKACSELVTSAYRSSYFNPLDYHRHGVGLATARAGNVIGGGDWAADRLIPDIIKAIIKGDTVKIRNPYAIRPWQHVLEPLSGYLSLAQKLYEDGVGYSEAWNFGPDDKDAKEVEWIVKRICSLWGGAANYEIDQGSHPHEANFLKLDCAKAISRLGWKPKWDLETAIVKIIEWNRTLLEQKDPREVSVKQIAEYMGWEGENVNDGFGK